MLSERANERIEIAFVVTMFFCELIVGCNSEYQTDCNPTLVVPYSDKPF